MSATPKLGKLVLKIGSPTPTAIARVNDVKIGAFKRDTKDVTDLDSEGKEFIGGLPDYGEITFNLRFDESDTGHTSLLAAFDSGVLQQVEAVPDGSAKKWTCTGLITSVGPFTYSADAVKTADCTIKISGKAQLVTGA